jgi:CubicO group peptidase (beta-lactamase class C family)
MKILFLRVATAALLSGFAIVSFAGSLDVTPAEQAGMSAERLERIREHFQGFVDDRKSAGFQIVISRHGRVVMHENFGLADVTKDQPINDDTLFRIYSMTKPIVGTAMMILYEEGRFSLGDPIAKFIPAFADVKVYAGEDETGNMILEDPERPPTIHDLFQHTAGFTYGIFGDTAVDKMYRESELTDYDAKLPDLVDKIAGIPLLFQPGTQYEYSVAVDIQGYIIEVLTGMDAGTFIRKRVLDPLDMDETMTWVAPAQADRFASVHTHDEDGNLIAYSDELYPDISVNNFLRKPSYFSGGAQFVSTGDDYWRFAQMLLNGGVFNGTRILARPTVEMMTSNRLPESIPNRRIAPGWGFGINMSVVTDPTLIDVPRSLGEFRHGGLASTVFWVDPVEDVVVVMLSQYLPSAHSDYEDLLHRLVRAAITD